MWLITDDTQLVGFSNQRCSFQSILKNKSTKTLKISIYENMYFMQVGNLAPLPGISIDKCQRFLLLRIFSHFGTCRSATFSENLRKIGNKKGYIQWKVLASTSCGNVGTQCNGRCPREVEGASSLGQPKHLAIIP